MNDMQAKKIARDVLFLDDPVALTGEKTDSHPPTTEQNSTSKFRTQWSQIGDNAYCVTGPTIPQLPPGLYSTVFTNVGFIFSKIPHSTKKIIKFDDSSCDDIVKEIDRFWQSKLKYKEFDVQYKRGILLHGPQGSGKSSIIKLVIQDIIKRDGIALIYNNVGCILEAVSQIKAVEKDKPIVVIMEDVDAFLQYDESSILNLLDGSTSTVENVLFLATTNYPELLAERIKDRPSRFDRVIEIPCPSEKMREEYISTLFNNASVEISAAKLKNWVRDTAEFSFSHITELFLSVELYEKSYEEAIDLLNNMSKNITSGSYKTNKKNKHGVGFKPVQPAIAGIGIDYGIKRI